MDDVSDAGSPNHENGGYEVCEIERVVKEAATLKGTHVLSCSAGGRLAWLPVAGCCDDDEPAGGVAG